MRLTRDVAPPIATRPASYQKDTIMKLAEIAFACYIYSHMSNYDRSYLRFVEETSPRLDLRLERHQMALLKWLNDWGCRQFSKDYHGLAAKEIGEWYEEVSVRLFPVDKTLLSLSNGDFALAEQAYDGLVTRTASRRKRANGHETKVTIGPTGTAKILFAVRPNALIPWDDPIRQRFGEDNSARSYINYLRAAKSHLEELRQNVIREATISQTCLSCLADPRPALRR